MQYLRYLLPFVILIACQPNQEKTAEKVRKVKEDSVAATISRSTFNNTSTNGWIESDFINLDETDIEKPVIVYFWTTWCKGCKLAEKWYFEEPNNNAFLTKNYHLVKVNGDSTEIVLNNKSYGVSKEQAFRHELSLTYSKYWFGYPNILLFDKDLKFKNSFEPNYFMGMPPNNFLQRLDSIYKDLPVLPRWEFN